jgi:hypothetical protein
VTHDDMCLWQALLVLLLLLRLLLLLLKVHVEVRPAMSTLCHHLACKLDRSPACNSPISLVWLLKGRSGKPLIQ